MVDDFVVQGAAAFWVGVADYGGVGGVGATSVKYCFELARWAPKVFDGPYLGVSWCGLRHLDQSIVTFL